MKKLLAIILAGCLVIPTQASAATKKPTPKPTTAKSKVVAKPIAKKPVAKKPVVKKPVAKKPVAKKPVKRKPVVRKKKKLPPKKPTKWPPPGFEKKDSLYAKTATQKELLIAATENEFIMRNLIDNCEKVACLGIFVGSETGCDWWEVSSNVLGRDPANPAQRIIYGSLRTFVSGSKAKSIKPILLISEEPIADGLGIDSYTANCRSGPQIGKIPSNTYTKTPARS
jgi:hypothetical protein